MHLEGIPADSGIYEVSPGKVLYASYVMDAHPWQAGATAEAAGAEADAAGPSGSSESPCSLVSDSASEEEGRSRSRSPYRDDGQGRTSPDTLAEGVPFLLLGQEYAPEMVIVPQDSTEMSTVLQSVQSRRDGNCRRRFAQIIPVHPQPAESYALAIVKPAWSREVYVVFDCLRVNGSVFCWLASAAMTRSAILAVAGLPDTSEHDVYVPDQDLPLGARDVCRLSTGACVSVVPRSCPWFVVASLQDMLLDSNCWSTAAALPCVPGDWLYVLSDTGPCCMQISEARPDELFSTVAEAFGVPLSRATFQLATPPVDDFSDEGRIAWNIAVLTNTPSGPLGPEGCVYFLDLRALMCGLTWAFTPDGIVSVALVKAQCARPAAGGHLVEVLGGRPVDPSSPDEVRVWPGEVLVVQVLDDGDGPAPALAIPNAALGPGDAREEHVGGDPGSSAPSGEPASRESSAGTGMYAGDGPFLGRHMTCPGPSLLQVGVSRRALLSCAAGLLLTSALMAVGTVLFNQELVLMLFLLRCRRHRQLIGIAMLYASCMPTVASMQTRPVCDAPGSVDAGTGLPLTSAAPLLRPVATPCRIGIRRSSGAAYVQGGSGENEELTRPLRTLLEESAEADPAWFGLLQRGNTVGDPLRTFLWRW